MDFKKIIGHKPVIGHLQNAIRLSKVSHAYIFNGEDGCGKNMVANAFASALLCEAGGIEPCGSCRSCLQAESGNHPDIIRVSHDKSVISVDDIREQLNTDIQIKPYSSPYKIYIVDEAEKLNEQAQNALLKTLEEPPAYAVILLLTNNSSRFLATILSRCILLDFKPVPKEKIKQFLMEDYSIPDYQAQVCAVFSAGSPGKALKYAASEEFIERKDTILHLVKYMKNMEFQDQLEALKYFVERKQAIDELVELMILWFRDVLMFKATKNVNLILYKEEINEIQKQAQRISFEGLNQCIEAFDKFRIRLKANVNFETAAQLLLFTLQDGFKGRI